MSKQRFFKNIFLYGLDNSKNKYKLGSRNALYIFVTSIFCVKKVLSKRLRSDSRARIAVRASMMTVMTHRNLAESLANKTDKRQIAY